MLPPGIRPRRRLAGRLLTALAITAAPLTAVTLTTSAAHADADTCGVDGNLVVDCGFESGTAQQAPAPGWTLTPASTGSDFWTYDIARSGTYAASFSAFGSDDDTISQTLSGTTPGATYTASFWAAIYYRHLGADHLNATVTGATEGTVTIADTTNLSVMTDGWTKYSVTFTAGSSAPTINIAAHAYDWLMVDDVSVAYAGPALPASVPGGTYNTAYSTSLAASGGTAPYTYEVTDGSLPAGLTLDPDTGLLSGTPTAAGDASFTVTATDSSNPAQIATQAYTLTVAKAASAPSITDPTEGGVVGQTATLAASSNEDEGAITYQSNSTDVCTVDGTTVTYLHPGTCTLEADQASSANYAAGSATDTLTVAQATTTTTVAVHPTTITADVNVDSPGAGDPTGDVTFQVGDQVVGTAPVQNGTATLDYTVPTGTSNEVAATYAGDTDFTGSSASTSRNDPSITARLTSHSHKTAAGWYHSPVTVHFTCTTNGADLVQTCPAPVTLSKNVAGGSVTKTITATDGGAATVTVTGINIDHTAPQVHVTGIHNGATYQGKAPAARCLATDRLSGIANCRITRHTHGGVTHYTATAKDKAGNTTSTHGTYRVLSTYLTGAPLHHGAFQVHRRAYSLVTRASTRPSYVNAAPAPARPSGGNVPFTRAGHHTWAIAVSLAGLPSGSRWNLGIRVGGKLRIITVHVH